MLATLNDVLPQARKGHYAVPAFDVCEDVYIRTLLDTAERERSPIIIMAIDLDLVGKGMAYIASSVRGVADMYDIPIVLHLDHARDLELVKAAIDHGFTSVMFDASVMPFEQNAELTRKVVEMAHPHGITVEAELGFVGGMSLDDKEHVESVLTDPQEVVRFVAMTEVDALAVSIGTAHGVYRSLPTLNIGRLKEIVAASDVPLVLHGGSGTPTDQVQEAIRNGITKINIFADMRQAIFAGLKESAKLSRIDPLPEEMYGPMKKALSAAAAGKMRECFSANRIPPTANFRPRPCEVKKPGGKSAG